VGHDRHGLDDPGTIAGVKAFLVAAGGLVTVIAVVGIGLWDVPDFSPLPVALVAAIVAVIGATLAGFAVRRAWSRRSELPLSIVFYTWLFVVSFLIASGLLRRILALTFVRPIPESVAYAERTDALLIWGLFLNAAVPLAGLLAAMIFQRRRWRLFAGAIGGAVIIFVLVGLAATMADAPLFGQATRIVKP
jgi:hypothetical protein